MDHKSSYSLGKYILRGEGEEECFWREFQASSRNFAAHGWRVVCAGVVRKICGAACGNINASQMDLLMDTW